MQHKRRTGSFMWQWLSSNHFCASTIVWHYYTTYLKTGDLFYKPHINELRRTLLMVPLWDFQSLNNVFWDRERKVLKSWQRLFTLTFSPPSQQHFPPPGISHTSTFQLCITWHFKVKEDLSSFPSSLEGKSFPEFSIQFQPLMSENLRKSQGFSEAM